MSKPTVIATLVKNAREQVRVSLDHYQGHDLIDVRVVMELNPETKAMMPTKKGISLRIEQLPDLISALRKAVEEARRRGLLDQKAA
jgi:hypothetical protein